MTFPEMNVRFLPCVALVIAGASFGSTCFPPPKTTDPLPCPDGNLPIWDGTTFCHCKNDPSREVTCPPGHSLAGCLCFPTSRIEGKPGNQPCASVIQELTFKNTIGCINCATDFCLDDKNLGLQEALKDESECNKILECLTVNGEECGCIA